MRLLTKDRSEPGKYLINDFTTNHCFLNRIVKSMFLFMNYHILFYYQDVAYGYIKELSGVRDSLSIEGLIGCMTF